MKTDVYNVDGKKTGSIDLPRSIFELPWNNTLMHQVVVSMQANARARVAHTKGRSDVKGGGRKPWRQKGTGRARHGSIRSPLWRGGGITFGPSNERVFTKSINKKMRTKALFVALSRNMFDGAILFVDELSFNVPKTAFAKKALTSLASVKKFENLNTRRKNGVLIIVCGEASVLKKSFNNMGNVTVVNAKDLNPVTVLQHVHLIFVSPKECIAELEKRAQLSSRQHLAQRDTSAKKKTSKKR